MPDVEAELRARAESDGVEFFFAMFVDMHGKPCAKMIPVTALDVLLGGAGFAGFAAGPMGQSPADPDMIAVPDPASYTLVPWQPGLCRRTARSARLLQHNHTNTGHTPCSAAIEDVRGSPVVVFDELASARNRLRPAVGIDSGRNEGAEGIAMTGTRQILFIQGGGAGVHDEWDDRLVESLRRALGDGYEVRYPRMPDEGDPSYARWSAAIRRELADLDDGAVVVGHSVGAAILIDALAEQPPERGLGAIVLIAAPFVGEGGWPSDEFALTSDLGARLPPGVRVHVFHGLQDETAPPSHADLYALAIPQAQVHRLPGRDHQLNNDLSEVAEAIRINRPRPVPIRRAEATSHQQLSGRAR